MAPPTRSVAVSTTWAGPRTGAAVSAAGAALRLSAARMKSRQISAGRPPPVTSRMGVSSSLPTHTPTIASAVKPTNQASRLSCVVPVLPAAGRS